jgi:hypothetical protein
MNHYQDMSDGTTRLYLSDDVFSVVDSEDVPRIRMFLWRASAITERNLTQYARSTIGGKTLMLHRLILSFPIEGQVDHVDQNGLNNTKKNLRTVSATMNSLNKPRYKGKPEEIPKGIRLRRFKTCVGYNARIRVGGELFQLGTFRTLEYAIAARDHAETIAMGLTAEPRWRESQSNLALAFRSRFSRTQKHPTQDQ